ncbi:hypothetical protein PI124_g17341 [Phytophthora idaei]|nr:hypothetical protein PI125_g17902 [Phytophthora idaei]KAG3139035.1 hypothetical protein PI126_g16641 [Phytophthora idaei]KAG3237677.1 hypothetical protein PI124_g17341 [Phytophthora idaei]
MGIETWDYNNFLQRFEGVRSDRRLTWMGGQPGRNSAGAKTYAGSTIDNRNELFSLNRAAYTSYEERESSFRSRHRSTGSMLVAYWAFLVITLKGPSTGIQTGSVPRSQRVQDRTQE